MFSARDLFRTFPIATRLAPRFDPACLARDLAAIDPAWWGAHEGPYHDGAWESVALWSPRGDRTEQRSFGGELARTEALDRCPAMESLLDSLHAERSRVRLMRLRPGGHILRHSDPLHTISASLVRLHVPVVTNAQVRFMIDDRRLVMEPGALWHVDVRFPHEVENAGDSARVHLVIDLIRNDEIDRMLAAGEVFGIGSLREYFLAHAASTAASGTTTHTS